MMDGPQVNRIGPLGTGQANWPGQFSWPPDLLLVSKHKLPRGQSGSHLSTGKARSSWLMVYRF